MPGTVIGQVVSGYICRRLSLDVKGMLKFLLITIATSIVTLPSLLARCPTTVLAGVGLPYSDRYNIAIIQAVFTLP